MTENFETPDQHDDAPSPDEGLRADKPLPRDEG